MDVCPEYGLKMIDLSAAALADLLSGLVAEHVGLDL